MEKASEKKPRESTGIGEMFRVFDEIAFNNENTGSLKIRRSSILKVQRNSDVEIYDPTEDLQASGGRKSMKKRVSFAEKFQVMELQTGNIYDIIGKKDESTPASHSFQSNITEEVESSCLDKSMNICISDDLSLESSGDDLSNTETAGRRHEDCTGDPFIFKNSEPILPESYEAQLCGLSDRISVEVTEDGMLKSKNSYDIDYSNRIAACVDGKSPKINAELPSYLSVPQNTSSTVSDFRAMYSDPILQLKHSEAENCNSVSKEALQRNKIYSLDSCDPLNKENVFPGKKLNQIRKQDFPPKTTSGYQFSEGTLEKNNKVLSSFVQNSGEENKVTKLKSSFDELLAANKENVYIGGGVNLISARNREVEENEMQLSGRALSAQVHGLNKANYSNVPLDLSCAVSAQVHGLNKTNYSNVPLDLTAEFSSLPAESLSKERQIHLKSLKRHNESDDNYEFHSPETISGRFCETKLVSEDMEITCGNLDDVFISEGEISANATANESTSCKELPNSGKHCIQDSLPGLSIVTGKHASKIARNKENFDFMPRAQDFSDIRIQNKGRSPGSSFPSIFSDRSQNFLVGETENRQNKISPGNSMNRTMSDQQLNSSKINSRSDVGLRPAECAENILESGAVAFDTQKSPVPMNNTLYFHQNLDMTCAHNQEGYFFRKQNMSLTDDFGKYTEYSCKMLEETGVKETTTAADNELSGSGLGIMEDSEWGKDHECLDREQGQKNAPVNHQNLQFRNLSDPDHEYQITSDQSNMISLEFSQVNEKCKGKSQSSFTTDDYKNFNENLSTLELNASERSLARCYLGTGKHFIPKHSEADSYDMQVPNVRGSSEAQYNDQPLHVTNSGGKYKKLRTGNTPVILRSGSHTDSFKRCYSSEISSQKKHQNFKNTGISSLPRCDSIESNVLNSNVSLNEPVTKRKASVDLTNIDCNDGLLNAVAPISLELLKSVVQQTEAEKLCKSKSYSSLPQTTTENVSRKRRHSDFDFPANRDHFSENSGFHSKNRQRMYEYFRENYQNFLKFLFRSRPAETLSRKDCDGNVSTAKPNLKSLLAVQEAKNPYKADIMYAIKRLRNCASHPSGTDDVMLFSSELLFTLKRNPVLKPSFSCMKLQASHSVRKSLRECDWKILEASFNSGRSEAEANGSMRDLFSSKTNRESLEGVEANEPTHNRSITVSLVEQIEVEHEAPDASADDCLQLVSDSILQDTLESQTVSLLQANFGLTRSTLQKSKYSIAESEPSLPLQNSKQLHESTADKNAYFFANQVSSSIKPTSQNNVFNVDEQKQLSSTRIQTSETQFPGKSLLSAHKALEDRLSVTSSLNLVPQSLQGSIHNKDGSSMLPLPLYSTPGNTSSEVHQYHVPFHKNKTSTIDISHQSPAQNSRHLQDNTKYRNKTHYFEKDSLSSKHGVNLDGEKGIENLTSEVAFSDVSCFSFRETEKKLSISMSSKKNFVHSSSQTPAQAPRTPTSPLEVTSNMGKASEEDEFDISNLNISKVSLPSTPTYSISSDYVENVCDDESDEEDIEKFLRKCEDILSCELSSEKENNVVSENGENENEETNSEMECSDDDVEARHCLRLYFVKESQKIDHEWKLRLVTENEVIFEMMHGRVHIHVPRESPDGGAANGSNITFTCCPSGSFMDPSIAKLGYEIFMSRVRDTFIKLPLCPKDVIEKLQSYLEIARVGRVLMRDIDFISTCHEFSSSISDGILRFSAEVHNRKHSMLFFLIFPVNMQTYPDEKIIPDVEFTYNFKSAKKEDILCCVENIQPGENYLYRMVEAARWF